MKHMEFKELFQFKIGLVLSGGGAKGAYQIGVFKALKELELYSLVTAVSGTSIGALNGALFLMGDMDLWFRTWQDANFENFFFTEETREERQQTNFLNGENSLRNSLEKLENSWDNSGGVKDFLLKQNISFFSQKGLSNLIDRHLDLQMVRKSSVSFHACAYNIDRLEPEYFHACDLDEESLKSVLMASASIPFIYEPVKIGHNRYSDGGIKNPLYQKENVDKVPIKPVCDSDCDILIVVYMNHGDTIDFTGCMDKKLIEIYPSLPLEDIKGTGSFDFSRSSLGERIEMGYHDAMFILAPMMVKWFQGKNADKLFDEHHRYNSWLRKKFI